MTGVQRYVQEVWPWLEGRVETIAPRRGHAGLAGHGWEQVILPTKLKGRLLWSPSNTGPLAVEHQVVTVHDVVPLDHPEWLTPKFAAWYRFLLPRLVRKVRHVIAISAFTKQRLMATTGIPPDRVTVVLHGLDGRFRPQTAEAVAAVRRRLSLPTGPYLLTLGSLEPRKNLRTLLSAWATTQKGTAKDWWLVVAGGKGKPAIFGEVELGRVPERTMFTERVPDDCLPALYAGAQAFAYVSYYEGFGFPPLEAMACGTPVLASATSAFPEIIGEAGILVDPHRPEAVAAGLRRLIEDSDLRERMQIAGQARAGAYSWKRAAEETLRVLEEHC